jgi:hypothetical protein
MPVLACDAAASSDPAPLRPFTVDSTESSHVRTAEHTPLAHVSGDVLFDELAVVDVVPLDDVDVVDEVEVVVVDWAPAAEPAVTAPITSAAGTNQRVTARNNILGLLLLTSGGV